MKMLMLSIPLMLLCNAGTIECMHKKSKLQQVCTKIKKDHDMSLHREVTYHQPSSFSRNLVKWGCVAFFMWPLFLGNQPVSCNTTDCVTKFENTCKKPEALSQWIKEGTCKPQDREQEQKHSERLKQIEEAESIIDSTCSHIRFSAPHLDVPWGMELPYFVCGELRANLKRLHKQEKAELLRQQPWRH